MTAPAPITSDLTSLYRCFDHTGALLYIGVSTHFMSRLAQHKDKPWFTSVSSITVMHFKTRSAALEAERKAILEEAPYFNLHHNLYADFEKPGRKRGRRTAQLHPKMREDVAESIISEAKALSLTQGEMIELMWEIYCKTTKISALTDTHLRRNAAARIHS